MLKLVNFCSKLFEAAGAPQGQGGLPQGQFGLQRGAGLAGCGAHGVDGGGLVLALDAHAVQLLPQVLAGGGVVDGGLAGDDVDFVHAREAFEPGLASRLLADDYFDGDQIQSELQEAVALLPDVQRTVFTLKYYDNMKYSEMSKVLSTSEGALKASYHLAVKKITDFFNRKD